MLYLHGFGSCGEGNKSKALIKHFDKKMLLSPDLPYVPLDAIRYIRDIITKEDVGLVIGSSLGGFYATYLAEKFQLPAILLNPSVQPWETLAPYVGWQERFCDQQIFEFKSVYLEQLKTLKVTPDRGKYLVLLQSGDEVLDYKVAKEYYKNHKIVVEYGGNHRFENIDDYLSMIENFRNQHECY